MLTWSKQIQKIWHPSDNGLLVPGGYVSDRSRSDSETYIQIKEKAIELEAFYEEVGVKIRTGCGLALLIECAKNLSDSWLTGRVEEVSDLTLWRSTHLNRVSDSILTLRNDENIEFHLKKLMNGTLDLLCRERSEAKDFLWELELLHSLRTHSICAELREPPDIVANFNGEEIGIACKKVYLDNNFEKVLSNGVAQIEKDYAFGIVAINIDDLAPPESMLVAKSEEEMAKYISEINLNFLKRHERHFRKYLSTGRILSALISMAVLADLRGENVRLTNARQSSVWMIPGLSDEKSSMFYEFYDQIMA